MAPQTPANSPPQPGKTDLADSGQRGIDETRARSNADASTAAAGAGAHETDTPSTGIDERLRAQKEGRHIQAKDASGKPYADSDDPDAHEKGRHNIGR